MQEGCDMAASVHPLSPGPRRRPTATSNFGVGRRESHDAGAFYARFTPPGISDDAEIRRPRLVDSIWCHDSADMDHHVEDKSVALVVTSPPYFAGKAYEEALGEGHIPTDYDAYLTMLHSVFEQCRAKLEPGGRIAVNVANLGRKPYRSLSADVSDILEQLGFLLRGEIIWQKSHAAGGSCAWGTYQRPGNPVLRDVTERIIVASKGRFDRAMSPEERLAGGWPNEGSIFKDDFVDATTDVWDIPAESATRIGHPAPFPVELPRRLIELYTYRGDLVLDPFVGSGSTAVAALRTERHYIGFDTEQDYVDLAEQRIEAERQRLVQRTHPVRRVVVPPVQPSSLDGDHGDFRARAVREGQRARELALTTLRECGFTDIDSDVKYTDLGVEVSFRALDHKGRPWLFDVSGAFSSTRPGLKRTDTLWKALGKAAVLHEERRTNPKRTDLGALVLLSTDLPARQSAGGKALAAMCGPTRAVHDVVELLDDDGLERLEAYALDGRERR
jgi:site-specific DNA-methyltransferase (adenine-specific)